MNRAIRSLQTVADLLERVARWLATGFMLLMLLCILLQIVARYLFDQPPAWTEELARLAMIWAGFLGASVACRRRLDPVLMSSARIARPVLRQAARWLEALAIAIFAIPILLAAPRFLELHAERNTDSLQLPSVLVVVIIPLCIAVILFHAVARVLIESAQEQPRPDRE